MKTGLIAALAAAAALSVGGAAYAQDTFPSKPVTILVPAAAGGPSDTVARLVAEAMTADLGQQVLVENVGGAGGSLGSSRIAAAAPDGYSLLLYHVSVATYNALYKDLTFKTGEAFATIGLITEVPMTIVTKKNLAPANIGALLTYLKAEGIGATFGTAGVGAASDLCGRLLEDATGIKFTMVPYKGTGPAMTDLIGGHIDVMCDQTTNTVNPIKAGEIKGYATTTRERLAVLPDLPTLREAGVKDFDFSAWHALWAPKATPDAIKRKLSASLQKALKQPKVVERFVALGTTPVAAEFATPEAGDKHFQEEIVRWNRVLANAK